VGQGADEVAWTGEMTLPYELADWPVSLLNAEDA
jgi:hypothetical protein